MPSRLIYPTRDQIVEYPADQVEYPARPDDVNELRDDVKLTHGEGAVGADDVPAFGDPLEALVKAWVAIACDHARTRKVDDMVVADVVGLDGAWAQGSTCEEALRELPSVLNDWVWMKLRDGDRDIPAMEGVQLIVGD